VLAAPGEFLSPPFVEQASEADFQAALVRFYEASVPPGLHTEVVRRRAGVVRHALGHLLRCPDPLAVKAERCLAPDGAYRVAGLGPVFWSALFQGLNPLQHPAWTPAVEAGLRRFGLDRRRPHDGPSRIYAAIQDAYDRLRSLEPGWTALHVDHFLHLVAAMQGRDLFGEATPPQAGEAAGAALGPDVVTVIRRERARLPLRRRLKERGQALHEARRDLEGGLAAHDAPRIGAALAVADPAGSRCAAVDCAAHAEAVVSWVGRLWKAEDPYEVLEAFWRSDPIPGAGLWLPAAVAHLKDPRQFHPWDERTRQGYTALDGSADLGAGWGERYRLFNEGAGRLRDRHGLHPLEVPAVLAGLAPEGARGDSRTAGPQPLRFGGFCEDTFRFLAELGRNNRREWMDGQRDRYRFAVREPLVELCRALAERYVEPVLRRDHGWELETAARNGRALTSICKNDYGRSVPYHAALWITFFRRTAAAKGAGGRGAEAQFFVRLDAAGLSYGVCLGREAREAGRLFRRNVQGQAELLYRSLSASGALAECGCGTLSDLAEARCAAGQGAPAAEPLFRPAGPEELKVWAATGRAKAAGGEGSWGQANGKAATAGPGRPPPLVVAKVVAADSHLLRSEELVGDVLLTFDRLLPVYACAVEPDPEPVLARRAGAERGGRYTEADFRRATFLGDDWLRRACALLDLKRQLILQGVPGTGKTHVARCLARLLTGGRDGAVRLVQFHPAYSYEEFVEGIKVRSVEVNGRHDVTYPVEDGLLCAFAAEAARRPAEPHVLLIDEINRGNLPRVFGELLYLLEYRGQAVELPYSKRGFRLPANLFLIGTMNAADRSVALVDQALRRRFSFLDMPPDAAVLAAWLRAHPPAEGPAFGEAVVGLFERLNTRLRSELGPSCQVGHSYFMAPDLDEARLRVVWQHHVGPLLDEYFASQPGRAAGYDLDELLANGPGRRKRQAAVVPG
jgi:MoxR-like ATPase